MAFTTSDKTGLQSDAQALLDKINALPVDDSLQAQLDAAIQTNAKLADKLTRIAAQMDAADSADTANDAARAGIRSIIAE